MAQFLGFPLLFWLVILIGLFLCCSVLSPKAQTPALRAAPKHETQPHDLGEWGLSSLEQMPHEHRVTILQHLSYPAFCLLRVTHLRVDQQNTH